MATDAKMRAISPAAALSSPVGAGLACDPEITLSSCADMNPRHFLKLLMPCWDIFLRSSSWYLMIFSTWALLVFRELRAEFSIF
jgi:hypothetical protein